MQDTITPKGRYRFTTADVNLADALYAKVLAFMQSAFPRDDAERHEHFLEFSELVERFHIKAGAQTAFADNLVPTVGKSVVAQRWSGTTTYTGIVNYVALGTGTTDPTASDTQLGTEGYRAAPSSSSFSSNVANLSLFIAAGTATGTWVEAGLFIDGTASANTGQLTSHVQTDITKGATNSLTIECALTAA